MVDEGFDVMTDVDLAGFTLKRKSQSERADSGKRQKAWIRRQDDNTEPLSWRPVQLNRMGTSKLMHNWDMQFSATAGHRGLIYFYYDEKNPAWQDSNWRRWPWMCLGLDMDGTNMFGLHHDEYHYHLNISGLCDWAHGTNRDESGALDEVGLGDLWKLIMVGLNVPFGRLEDEQARLSRRTAVNPLLV